MSPPTEPRELEGLEDKFHDVSSSLNECYCHYIPDKTLKVIACRVGDRLSRCLRKLDWSSQSFFC